MDLHTKPQDQQLPKLRNKLNKNHKETKKPGMNIKIALSYLLISCTIISKGQDLKLKSFKIIAVEFGITSPNSISCSEFESSFSSNSFSSKIFTDSAKVFQFEKFLKKIKFRKNNLGSINVRAKIYLNYGLSHSERILCIDKFYDMELDGMGIKKNKHLINFLSQFFETLGSRATSN